MNRKKILLTDDPELVHAMRSSFFRREGFSFLLAGSSQQAFEIIEEEDPVLAILDLTMAGEGGDGCCRRVKNDPLLRTTRIALIAPADVAEDLKRCHLAGCDAVISRPIDPHSLVAAACRILEIVDPAAPRIDVDFPLRCGVSSSALAPGRALNLNVGGMFIQTEQLLPVDAEMVVEFSLPSRPQGVRCRCRVAWVNHPEWVKVSRLQPGMGVEFLDLPVSCRQAIESFLAAGPAVIAADPPLPPLATLTPPPSPGRHAPVSAAACGPATGATPCSPGSCPSRCRACVSPPVVTVPCESSQQPQSASVSDSRAQLSS